MRPAVCHFVGRLREAVLSPRLLAAGLIGGIFAVVLDARLDPRSGHPLLWKMFYLTYIGGLASIIGPGAASSPGQGRFWSTRFIGVDHRDWSHPPLPLGPKSRLLAEALAAVLLILVWRTVLEPVFLLARASVSSVSVSRFAWDRLVDACVIVPCAVAWLSPSRVRVIHVVRVMAIGPLVVSWSLLAPRIGTWSSCVMGLVLTAGLLQLSQVRFRLTMPFRGLARAGALVRRARAPESQLRRDLWCGPLRNNLLLTAATVVALIANAVVHLMSGNRSFAAGVVIGISVSFLFLPLGLPLLGRQGQRGGTPLFGGWFVAAWAALPVHRDALLRSVYAHGLIWGCCVTLWMLAVMLTEGDLGNPWLGLPVGLAASASVAGALVCIAVGDRRRGMLSMGAVVFALGAFALPDALASMAPLRATVVAAAAAALAGAAGGLPPLVHLVARSTQRRP